MGGYLVVGSSLSVNRSGAVFPTDEWTVAGGYNPETWLSGLEMSGDFRSTGRIFLTNGTYFNNTHLILRNNGQILRRGPGGGTNITRIITENNNANTIHQDLWGYLPVRYIRSC